MFQPSDTTVRERALAHGRRIYCRAIVTDTTAEDGDEGSRTYTSNDNIVSWGIDIGTSSGGFKIGAAYSGKLTLRLMGNAVINQYDRITVSVGFYNDSGNPGTLMPMGMYWVDRVVPSDSAIVVTAYDRMLRGAKSYKSRLTYPCKASAMLEELCTQMGVSLTADFVAPSYDPTISEAPVKGTDAEGNPVYYTRREVLSYIGSLYGGSWYFNTRGRLALTTYQKVSEPMLADNSLKLDVSETPYAVTAIAWNSNGVTISRDPDTDALGVVEFSNPLAVDAKEPILNGIETKLLGISYHNAVVERQGCGWYELGDIVDAYAADGTVYPLLISGINYSIYDGTFVEKIYSTALTDSESNYTSGDIEGETKPPSSATDTGGTAEKLQTSGSAVYAVTRHNSKDALWIVNEDGTVTLNLALGASNGFSLMDNSGASVEFSGGNTINIQNRVSQIRADDQRILLQNSVGRQILSDSSFVLYAQGNNSQYQVGSDIFFSLNGSGLQILSRSNNISLALDSTGLYVNGKKVLTEE